MRNILRFRVVAIVLLALGLFAGSLANVGAQATPVTGEPGSVVVSKFVCTQIEEPTATISDPVGIDTAAGSPDVEEGCSPSTASFQIYLNNDFTSTPFAEFDAGVATIDGVPQNIGGVPHLLLELDTNVFYEFFVAPGGVTTITVLNPADDGNATPVADDGGDDGTADGGTSGDGGASTDDNGDDDSAGGTSGGSVSTLPSTGQGADSGTSGSSIVLLFGAMSLVALAAGFAWRQRRTA